MRKAGIFELVFLGSALTILPTGRGWAQTFTASIVGTINDKTGGSSTELRSPPTI